MTSRKCANPFYFSSLATLSHFHYCYKVLRKLPYFLIDSFRGPHIPCCPNAQVFMGMPMSHRWKRMLWSLRMPRGWCDFIMRKIVLSPMEERVPLRLTQGAFDVNGWWAPKTRWIQYWHRRKQRKYGTTQFPTCQRFGDVATCGKKIARNINIKKIATQLTTPREGKWLERFLFSSAVVHAVGWWLFKFTRFLLGFLVTNPMDSPTFGLFENPTPLLRVVTRRFITKNSASSFFHRQLNWPKPRSVSKNSTTSE